MLLHRIHAWQTQDVEHDNKYMGEALEWMHYCETGHKQHQQIVAPCLAAVWHCYKRPVSLSRIVSKWQKHARIVRAGDSIRRARSCSDNGDAVRRLAEFTLVVVDSV
jgi:hypothetical protein